jgi:2'-5' RNA ligase
VRWTAPDALHVTLKFLGEVAAERRSAIEGALQDAVGIAQPFELRLAGIGGFPSLRRARVFWLGARADAPLLQLQRLIEQRLEPIGFEREARSFHPHVTVGRVGPAVSATQLERAERAAAELMYETAVAVRSVELMQSRLVPGGARYEALVSVPLGPRTGDK